MLSLRNLILAHFGTKQRKARRCQLSLGLLTIAGVIFRSELALLVANMTLVYVASLKLSLQYTIIPVGIASALLGLLVSVPVDSYLWQRFLIWPELDALLYNTVEGKSSDWGTSPWHYYFTNSIPKLMINPLTLLVCIPAALFVKTIQKFSLDLMYPLVAYVIMFSFLPHKEWRFIVYVIPGLTAVASAGASWIWTRRSKSTLHGLLALALAVSVLVSALASTALLCISSLNYPGGEVMGQLDSIISEHPGHAKIHLDNLSCQTGVTRFLQDRTPKATFDKTEDSATLLEEGFWSQFDYVLAEDGKNVPGIWRSIGSVDSYTAISLSDGTPIGASMCRSLFRTRGAPACDTLQRMEMKIGSRLLCGRWPHVVLEPRLTILKNEAST